MADGVGEQVRRALRRPLVAGLVLLAVYGLASLTLSDGGSLGTDTGAKAYTLEQMDERGDLRPAIGYWAEAWDPEGRYHPVFDTRRTDGAEWVNVTTLPMLVAARPLHALGGYRFALVLPMLGSVLAAFACRDLARRLGDEDDGWRAFWVVGLASPVAVYALDLWEHSLGAGLMVAAVALLVRFAERGPWWQPAAAGVLLGASATMRSETFVVALVAVATSSLVWLARRDLVRCIGGGALAMAGFAGPWFANRVLEAELGGTSRSRRIAREAQREFWTELGERSEEALITWFGVPGAGYPRAALTGAVAVGAVVIAAVLLRRGQHRIAGYALALGGAVVLVALASGLGFVPGALIASPVAIAGLLAWSDPRARVVLVATLVAVVLTWTFQLTGGALPQWGGRYLLAPTLVLTTLGVVHVGRRPAVLGRSLVAAAVVVTAFGVAWLSSRSHQVEDFFDGLEQREEAVIISTNGFLVREAMADLDDRRYLSLGRRARLDGAVDVVDGAGFDDFAVLGSTAAGDLPEVDAVLISSERVRFLGAPLWYHVFSLTGDGAGPG